MKSILTIEISVKLFGCTQTSNPTGQTRRTAYEAPGMARTAFVGNSGEQDTVDISFGPSQTTASPIKAAPAKVCANANGKVLSTANKPYPSSFYYPNDRGFGNKVCNTISKYFSPTCSLLAICFLTVTGLVFAALATPVLAEPQSWTQSKWILQIDQEKPLVENCDTNICADINKARMADNAKIPAQQSIKEWVEPKIVEIGHWMKANGYPQARTWNFPTASAVPPGQLILETASGVMAKESKRAARENRTLSDAEKSSIEATAASYSTQTSVIRLRKVDFVETEDADGDLLSVDESGNSGTLAHELFHAVHHASNHNMRQDPEWVREGLAMAVEYAWRANEGSKANTMAYQPKYDTPLAVPKDPYERGHFFYALGNSFGDKMTYAGQIVQKPFSGDGIQALDSFLEAKSTSLAKFYPNFIAKKTDARFFSPPQLTPEVWQVSVPASKTFELQSNVGPVATRYSELTVAFSGTGPVEEKDRIYLLDVSIPKADNLSDLSLIVGRNLKDASGHHLSMVLAQDGKLRPQIKVKVPNVADDAQSTAAQSYQLGLEASPVTFEMPECVAAGAKAEVTLKGNLPSGGFDQVKGVRLSGSAGRFGSGLTFTAPKRPQTLKIYLTLPTSSGGTKKILLGATEVGTSKVASLNHASSSLIGGYSLDIGATTVRAGGITMTIAKPFTIPKAEVKFTDGSLFLEALYQGKFVSFRLDGDPCGDEFVGTGQFATGKAEIALTVTKGSNGKLAPSGTMVHRSAQGIVTWGIVLNRLK